MIKNNQVARRNRITFFISSLSGGGSERVTCNLANYFYNKNFDVDVVTLSNKNDTYELTKGINRINLLDEKKRANRIKNIMIEWIGLKKYVKNNTSVPCYVTMLPLNAFLLTRLRRYIKGKIIISDRNDPTTYNMINRFLMKFAVKRCDGLVIQTKDISNYYRNIRNRIVIPNAINTDIIVSKRVKVENRIVAVGRLRKQKNYPMIIESFYKFQKKHPDYSLEIYGQGCEEESLKKLVAEYNLTDKVSFMGYVKDVPERISNAACFLMASNYEGMSNSLIEAMCIGIPCVVTDCDGGGARELINNMENGILVKKNAVDEMVQGLSLIIEDAKFSNKISNNAIKLRKKLNPEKIYNEWLDFVEKNAYQTKEKK